MPTVPTYKQRVNTPAAGSVQASADMPSLSLHKARAQVPRAPMDLYSETFRGMDRVVKSLADHAEQMHDEDMRSAMVKADTEMADAMRHILAEARQRKGEDALPDPSTGEVGVVGFVDKRIQDIAASKQYPFRGIYRQAFDEKMASRRNAALNAAANWEAQERRAVHALRTENAVQLEIKSLQDGLRGLVQEGRAFALLGRAFENVRDAVVTGLPGQAEAQAQALAAAHGAIVESAVITAAMDNPGLALRILEEHGGKALEPAKIAALREQIDKKDIEIKVRVAMDRISSLSYEQQLARVNGMKAGNDKQREVRRLLFAQVEAQERVKRAQEAVKNFDHFESLWDRYNDPNADPLTPAEVIGDTGLTTIQKDYFLARLTADLRAEQSEAEKMAAEQDKLRELVVAEEFRQFALLYPERVATRADVLSWASDKDLSVPATRGLLSDWQAFNDTPALGQAWGIITKRFQDVFKKDSEAEAESKQAVMTYVKSYHTATGRPPTQEDIINFSTLVVQKYSTGWFSSERGYDRLSRGDLLQPEGQRYGVGPHGRRFWSDENGGEYMQDVTGRTWARDTTTNEWRPMAPRSQTPGPR